MILNFTTSDIRILKVLKTSKIPLTKSQLDSRLMLHMAERDMSPRGAETKRLRDLIDSDYVFSSTKTVNGRKGVYYELADPNAFDRYIDDI